MPRRALSFPSSNGRLLMPIEPVQILWVSLVVGGLQLAFVYLEPFNRLFRTQPLDAADWGMSEAVALVGFFVISLEKWFWRQKQVSSDAREWTG